MLYAYTKLKGKLRSLETIQSNCSEKQLDMYVTKTEIHMKDIFMHSKECIFLSVSSAYIFEEFNIKIKDIIGRVSNVETVEQLVLLIGEFTELFTENMLERLSRNNATDRNGYEYNYPAIPFNINFNRKSNILFYDCPSTIEESKLSTKTDLMETYGIYIGYNNNCPRIENIAYGIGGNARISNNSFDVLVCASIGKSQCTGFGIRQDIIKEEEKDKLISASKYLAHNGILNFMVPIFRIDHSLCMYLATNFTDFHLYRVNSIYVEVQCIKKEKGIDYEDYHLLRNATYDMYNIPYITNNDKCVYNLINDYVAISHFRGSKITDAMINTLKSASDCMQLLAQEQVRVKQKDLAQPLLPFNTGQIGLIMASGNLDGVVYEKDGGIHIIKGRVERKSTTVDIENGTEVLEYSSVKINALTPSGKLIKIE